MRMFKVEYSPYSLKLKVPFSTSKGTINQRSGFLIKIVDESGLSGIGDCSPFPEFGSESLQEAENNLKKIIYLSFSSFDIESIKTELKKFAHSPALSAGLEQALLQLYAQNNNQSLMSLFGLKSPVEISVNGVIGFLSLSESKEKAKYLIESGFETIKVKTGRNNFDEDYKTLSEIRNVTGENIKLRIDSNGEWDLTSAKKYLKQLEPINLEYAEQPVNTLEDFIELKKETSVPLAPDESVRSVDDAQRFIENNAADYLILKPMMIGGILTALEIINNAKQAGIKIVITSSFESAIGRKMDVLAAALVEDDTAHGLSIADYFESDLIKPIDVIKNGKIHLSKDEI